MSFWKFLGIDKSVWEKGSGGAAATADTETVRKIVKALEALEPNHARYIAAFAYLLGRVANADHQISDEETGEMERIVRERGKLPEEQAILVVQMAKTQNLLFGGTENFLVGREFEGIADREQKLTLLRSLYAIAAADRSISTVEDNEIRQISRELHLDHEDLVAVRLEFREYLAVLQNLPNPGTM